MPPPVNSLVGIRAVLEALEGGRRRFERILIQSGRRDRRMRELQDLARRQGVPVRVEPREALDRLSEGQLHQGVVALAGGVEYSSEEEILTAAGERPFLVVLDQVQDPRNLGAVARAAAGAGAHGILLSDRGTASPTAAAHRAAAGALDRVPLARVGNIPALLDRLAARGIWVIGLDPEGQSLWGGFDLTLPLALVVGSEGKGLRRLVRERCELLLGIPMPGGGGSLNLATAAAVALFEVVRARAGGEGDDRSL